MYFILFCHADMQTSKTHNQKKTQEHAIEIENIRKEYQTATESRNSEFVEQLKEQKNRINEQWEAERQRLLDEQNRLKQCHQNTMDRILQFRWSFSFEP